jgi:hypothetical protein
MHNNYYYYYYYYIRVTTLTVTDMNMIKLAVGNLFDCMCMIC